LRAIVLGNLKQTGHEDNISTVVSIQNVCPLRRIEGSPIIHAAAANTGEKSR
jgi:hypothetical protein